MKKRRILLSCFIATTSLVLSACDFLPENFLPTRKDSSSQQSSSRSRISRDRSSSNGEHVHKFSEEWSYNSYNHWHEAICGHSLRSDLGEHDYYSAVIKQPTCTVEGEEVHICTVCDYRITTPIPVTDHNWFEYSRVEPTCTEAGSAKRYCTNCGVSDEEYLPPLDHDYQEIVIQEPTCSSRGRGIRVCRRCNESYEYEIGTADHSWGDEMLVEPTGDSVDYTMSSCMVCGTTRLSISAQKGTIAGSIKSSVASDLGFVKLSSNGNSITYKFNYSSTAYGKLYQHACCDTTSYSGYSYKTGARDGYPYNFQMSLNGALIDLTESGEISYGEFLDGGEVIPELANNNFSKVNKCLIGDVVLNAGENTLVFTRLGSYNLLFDSLIFEVVNSDHVHTASSDWATDENSHWHYCTDANCPVPNARIDGNQHEFGETIVVQGPTCGNVGIYRQICSVCGYQKDTTIPMTDHNFEDVGAFQVQNGSALLEEYKCTFCSQNFIRWQANDYDRDLSNLVEENSDYVRFQNYAENANGVEQVGSHIVYKINVPLALQNVGLSFYINTSSDRPIFDAVNNDSMQGYIYNQYGELEPSPKRYGLRVNNNEITLGEDTYTPVSTTAWFNWPVQINLVAGENIIDIYCLGSYRARIYQFQLTGVPFIEPNHVHTPGSVLYSDGNYHYYECVGGDGVRFNEEYHQFGAETVITPASCESDGMSISTCQICGYQLYNTLYAYGHSWDEGVIVTTPTHDEYGEKVYTCYNCGTQVSNVLNPGHNWGETTFVDGDYNHVGYRMSECLDDDFVQIDINAFDGYFSQGYSNVSNYIRLSSTNSSATYSFNYNSHAVGKLYLRATINTSNLSATFSTGGTGSNGCNFEVAVNNLPVDMSASKDTTYADLLGGGWTDPRITGSYSQQVNDILIGNIELLPGENNIVYTRTGSYNPCFSDLILVVEPSDHVHVFSEYYEFDDQYHWRTCLDPDCPMGRNAIAEKCAHNFVPVDEVTIESCNDIKNVVCVCTDCGYQKTFTDSMEHNFNESEIAYGTNSDGVNFSIKHCASCKKTVEAINLSESSVVTGNFNSGKLTQGTTLAWKFPVYQTGLISIYLPMKMSNSSHANQNFDPTLYEVYANGALLDNLLPSGTYEGIGLQTYDKYYKFATYYVTENDVANGEIEISLLTNQSTYRLVFNGEVRIEY